MKCGGGGGGGALPLILLAAVVAVGCPSEEFTDRPEGASTGSGATGVNGGSGDAGSGESTGNGGSAGAAGARATETLAAGAGGIEEGMSQGGAPPLPPMSSSPDCPADLDAAYEVGCTLEGKACVVVDTGPGSATYGQLGFVCRDGLWRLTGYLNACPENLCGDGDLFAVGSPCAGEGRVCGHGCCGDYPSGAVKCSGGMWKLTDNPAECDGEGGDPNQPGGGGVGEDNGGAGGQP